MQKSPETKPAKEQLLQLRKETLQRIYGVMTPEEVRTTLQEYVGILRNLPFGDVAYERMYIESSNLLMYLKILELETGSTDPFFKTRVSYIYSFNIKGVSDVAVDWSSIYLRPNGNRPTETEQIKELKEIVKEMLMKRFEVTSLSAKEIASIEVVPM